MVDMLVAQIRGRIMLLIPRMCIIELKRLGRDIGVYILDM